MLLLCYISVPRLFAQPPMSARMICLCGPLILHSAVSPEPMQLQGRKIHSKHWHTEFKRPLTVGAPVWLSWLSDQLWLRSWSQGFMSSSPASGSVLTAQSLEPASDSVSPPLSAPPRIALSLSLSLSKINIKQLKKNLKILDCKYGHLETSDVSIFSILLICVTLMLSLVNYLPSAYSPCWL